MRFGRKSIFFVSAATEIRRAGQPWIWGQFEEGNHLNMAFCQRVGNYLGPNQAAVVCLRRQAGVRHENCIKIFSYQILPMLVGVR
jgi:hypothetical protein